MIVDDGMRLLGIGAPDYNDVGLLKIIIRTRIGSTSKYSRQTDDAWGVSGPVATIHIVAANHLSHKFLGQEIQLIR